MHLFSSSVIIAVALLIAGCSSDPDPQENMNMTKSCSQTRCDQNTRRAGSYCGSCMSACMSASYDCNPSTACESSCGPHEVYCSDADRSECVSTTFKAELPANPSSELEAACNRARAHVVSCGQDAIGPEACHLFAQVERSELAATYDCMATQPCDAAPDACSPKPTTFGDDLCAGASRCPGFCNEERQKMLDLEGGWLRPDVQEAARSCLRQETCNDVSACLHGWYDAIVQ